MGALIGAYRSHSAQLESCLLEFQTASSNGRHFPVLMPPWRRQGWAGVGESAPVPTVHGTSRGDRLDDPPGEDDPPPTRPRALSPDLPDLPLQDVACLPPVPWGTTAVRVEKARRSPERTVTRRTRVAGKLCVATRVVQILGSLVDANHHSPYDEWVVEWDERSRDGGREGSGIENQPAREEARRDPARHTEGRVCSQNEGLEALVPTQAPVQTPKTNPGTAPPPGPSLTWDQHQVFLQFPPSKKRAAQDLPRGLAPSTLTELYRRVEREQRRFLAHQFNAVVQDPAALAKYRKVAGSETHVSAERKWRRGVTEAAFATGGVFPRCARLVTAAVRLDGSGWQKRENVELVALEFTTRTYGDASAPGSNTGRSSGGHATLGGPGTTRGVTHTSRGVTASPNTLPRGTTSPAVGDELTCAVDASCDASSSACTRAVAESLLRTQTDASRVDAVLTCSAFELFASATCDDGRTAAWDVPLEVVGSTTGTGTTTTTSPSTTVGTTAAGPKTARDSNKNNPKKSLRVFDPLPSRDLCGSTRERAEAYWERALLWCSRKNAKSDDDGDEKKEKVTTGSFRLGDKIVRVVFDERALTKCSVDYFASGASGSGSNREDREDFETDKREAVSSRDVARLWAHAAVRQPGCYVQHARVAVANGRVLSLDRVDKTKINALVQLNVAPSAPYLEAPVGVDVDVDLDDPVAFPNRSDLVSGTGRPCAETEDEREGHERDASAGGADAEPWFHNSFNPNAATRNVYGIIQTLQELTADLSPGRYVLSRRAGARDAALYVGEDFVDTTFGVNAHTDNDADTTNPAPARRRRGGRPNGERKNDSRKRKRPRGGGGLFGGVGVARNAESSDDETDDPAINESVANTATDDAETEKDVEPALGPRERRGRPVPGLLYDFQAAYRTVLTAEGTAEEGNLPSADRERVADEPSSVAVDAFDGASSEPEFVPPAFVPASHKTPLNAGQIENTFPPKGEPPQPGARRARKMWTSLLAPPTSSDGEREDTAVGVNSRGRVSEAQATAVSTRPAQTGRVVPNLRYCHKFAHHGGCLVATCPFPHLTLAEAERRRDCVGANSQWDVLGAGGKDASAAPKKGAYGNLVGAMGDTARRGGRKPSWAVGID